MPNKMTIHVVDVQTDDPNVKQTVSKFVIEEKDQVTFINKGTADATVNFLNGSPLCTGNSPPTVNPILLPLTNPEKKLIVCVDKGEFEYKASVIGALPEDPILIVERAQPSPDPGQVQKKPIVFPEDVVPMLLGLVIGAVIAFLILRLRGTRNP